MVHAGHTKVIDDAPVAHPNESITLLFSTSSQSTEIALTNVLQRVPFIITGPTPDTLSQVGKDVTTFSTSDAHSVQDPNFAAGQDEASNTPTPEH
jgi:hypothetical protein